MARSRPTEPAAGSDLFAALSRDGARRRTGVPCGFDAIRAVLSDAERARVDEIVAAIREDRRTLTQTRFSASWLADTLTDHGHKVGRLCVQNHVAGRCQCGY